MNLGNNTAIQFAIVAVLVGTLTRIVLFLLKPILQFPSGISLLLSIIVGCMAGYFLLYSNKNY